MAPGNPGPGSAQARPGCCCHLLPICCHPQFGELRPGGRSLLFSHPQTAPAAPANHSRWPSPLRSATWQPARASSFCCLTAAAPPPRCLELERNRSMPSSMHADLPALKASSRGGLARPTIDSCPPQNAPNPPWCRQGRSRETAISAWTRKRSGSGFARQQYLQLAAETCLEPSL